MTTNPHTCTRCGSTDYSSARFTRQWCPNCGYVKGRQYQSPAGQKGPLNRGSSYVTPSGTTKYWLNNKWFTEKVYRKKLAKAKAARRNYEERGLTGHQILMKRLVEDGVV